MPIIIPSECIYDKDNPKIRSNVIDKVSVDYTSVTRTNDYEKVVASFNFEGDEFKPSEAIEKNNQYINVTRGLSNIYYYAAAYVEIRPIYFATDFSISRILKNEYIQKLLVGLNKDKNPNIKFSIVGNLQKGNCTATGKYDGGPAGSDSISVIRGTILLDEPNYQQNDFRYDLPDLTNFSHSVTNDDSVFTATANVDLNFSSLENISDDNIVSYTDENTYTINIARFLVGATLIKLGAKDSFSDPGTGGMSLSVAFSGTYEKYTPKQLEVTFYGNTLLINISDGSAVYGSGEKPFSLSRNELMQESATTLGYKTTEFLANNILSQYATGKETATILCSISDYYDDNGTLYVSTKNDELPMTFQIGDEVVPMVFGADGKDHYMSMKNGEGKVFSVIGTKVFYDGAVWQELYLQEK